MSKARLFSGIAVGVSVAAVASFTALAGTTPAHAQTYITGNVEASGSATVSATGTGNTAIWTLNTGPTAGGVAQLSLADPPNLTATSGEPAFTRADSGAASSGTTDMPQTFQPLWQITLANGCTIEGLGKDNAPSSSTLTWVVIGPAAVGSGTATSPAMDWADTVPVALGTPGASGVQCGTAGPPATTVPVRNAALLASGPRSTTYRVTEVEFFGDPVVRNEASVTESATGRISNFASGRCLDVTDGHYRIGTRLQTWTCGAMGSGLPGGNQNFRIIARSDGSGALVARSPSGQIWYVNETGEDNALVLDTRAGSTNGTDNMLKTGPLYTFPPNAGTPYDPSTDLVMTSEGDTNGSGVIGALRVPNDRQRWHNPVAP